MRRVWPGRPDPLGATWDGEGVNFALFSQHASGVELCLFDDPAAPRESVRVPLRERTNHVWHAYLPDLRPGALYAYRVHGPWRPEAGHRFNPNKLLVDPYAKAISGTLRWSDALFGYDPAGPEDAPTPSAADSAAALPRCVVVDPAFTWGDDRPPRVPWEQSVLYECHVKGMTLRHPGVPEALRGRYLGLASEPIVEHLLRLGVTAVSLLPVHHSAIDRHLAGRGLVNYWGYNTLGFFAPDSRFASGALGEQVSEFKSMVKALHRAGLEVILDVVYNHTAEGGHHGSTLSLRGIDNAVYYRLDPADPRHYLDFTGCGNTLDVTHPRVLQLVLDSLRYWVRDMHVDGFRFDLAPVLGRDPLEMNAAARFFAVLQQDPVLGGVKLIAEPWDLGPNGFRLGHFPFGWSEWNAHYRDDVRRFWRGDPGQVPGLASRLAGSADVFAASGRPPQASINFVACHDGFTLHDLVCYERKHNEANGEDNRDGGDANWSRNWGVEGPAESVAVLRTRERTKRNFLATLAFSQGVPMLSHGDELGRTQRGNNNAYCHDDETTWIDWQLGARERALLEFAARVFAIRRQNPVFRRRRFFRGDPVESLGVKDVMWLHPDGHELGLDDWQDAASQALGMLIPGAAADAFDERGRPVRGATLLLLLNASARSRPFVLPDPGVPGTWLGLVDTGLGRPHGLRGGRVSLMPHSLMLLRHESAT